MLISRKQIFIGLGMMDNVPLCYGLKTLRFTPFNFIGPLEYGAEWQSVDIKSLPENHPLRIAEIRAIIEE